MFVTKIHGTEKVFAFVAVKPYFASMSLVVPLEDELGDVLEKALRLRSLSEEQLAGESGVSVRKIKDAFDYRYDFLPDEIMKLAKTLSLNEVGLSALAEERYPLPRLPAFPFVFRPFSLSLGSGGVNAYFVHERGCKEGLLFDTGYQAKEIGDCLVRDGLTPKAIFLTHADSDHIGGLKGLRQTFPEVKVFGPGKDFDGISLQEGEEIDCYTPFRIRVFDTCGHAERHFSYLLEGGGGREICIIGDLLFAGSLGGAFHCRHKLWDNFDRMLRVLSPKTILAPGHGPLSSVENERKFNPFAV